jgi:trans-aconitate methyltransferase
VDAGEWDARYADVEALWGVAPNVLVRERTADLPPGRAIDLAAGECRNALWLAAQGWQVTAVDFSPVALRRGVERAAAAGLDLEPVEADVLTWEPGAPVDLVVVAYLQLPPEQRERVLRRLPGWLAPGGTVVVVAHDRSNVAHGHGGPPSEDVCYDVAETAAALAPLEIGSAEVVRRTVATDDGDRIALDTLVVARRPGG